MFDFDVIVGIDWLHEFYASIDCRTRVVKLQYPTEFTLEWKEGYSICTGQFVSYLRAWKMISKRCIYHIIKVRDVESLTPFLDLVLVVSEFLQVFFDNLILRFYLIWIHNLFPFLLIDWIKLS